MVTLYGRSYEQWLVGGEVIDPTTLYFALTAAGTSEGARKAWETRGSSSAGDVADRIRGDHPGVTLELVDKVHGDPHWELDRLIVPNKGEGVGTQIMGELTDAADAAGMPIALTPEPIGSGSRTALERFYKRHGFVKNTGSHKLDSSKEAMVRYPKPAG